MKKRKGAALVLALVVTLVGAILIAAMYDYVNRYGRFSLMERAWYVDHTTLVSELQAMKGRIISDNEAAWQVRHAPALNYETPQDNPATTPVVSLDINHLRFGGENAPDDWRVRKTVRHSGVGSQEVEVEVFDMYFDPAWVFSDEWIRPDFPSAAPMYETAEDAGDGTSESESTDQSQGHHIGSTNSTPPETYGAYLMRASLYNGGSNTPKRVIEEVFIQSLPERATP